MSILTGTTTDPLAALDDSPLITDPKRPLLHPSLRESFKWGDSTATLHAQRLEPGSEDPHTEHYYLELPDGSFHEIQFCRVRQHLCHPPSIPMLLPIAIAFSREPDQSPELLADLAKACGIG